MSQPFYFSAGTARKKQQDTRVQDIFSVGTRKGTGRFDQPLPIRVANPGAIQAGSHPGRSDGHTLFARHDLP
jgi:hypothetical protein